jgi:O-antigen/teichoic acid export membrane protein
VVLMGYVFLGMYNNLVAGIYIEKKTTQLPWITGIGALVNVILNFGLIPIMGIMGAAIATLLAYFAMACAMALSVRKVYPVPYDWVKVGKAFLVAGAVFAVVRTVPVVGSSFWLRSLAVLGFGGLLVATGVIVRSEARRLAAALFPRW